MLALDCSPPPVDPDRVDQRVFMSLGWSQFEQFLVARGDTSANRITYLDGVTSGGLDKLAVYHRLKVPEVWVWEGGGLTAYVRRPNGYVARQRSELLPELDLAVLSRHSTSTDQHGTVKRYLASLRRH